MLSTPIAVVATAYCDSGLTKSGTYVHTGTVAVDRRVIRMHSHLRLTIEHATDWISRYMRGLFHHTVFNAEDTGSAIKGHRMDIWMPSCSDAFAWGRRRIMVEVVSNDLGHTQRHKHLRPVGRRQHVRRREIEQRARLSRLTAAVAPLQHSHPVLLAPMPSF